MDFTKIINEKSTSKGESSLEVEAYVSVSTDNDDLAGLFNELMDKDTISPECCMETVKITFCGCDESVTFDAGDIRVCSTGSVLNINLTLQEVCPDKRIALAVVLTEIDSYGKEHSRGMKTLTVPAHHNNGNADINVSCIRFVLPDDLNFGDNTNKVIKPGRCDKRNFKARIMSNYVDNNFLG